MSEMTRDDVFQLRLSEKEYDRLEWLSYELGRTKADTIRRAVRLYLYLCENEPAMMEQLLNKKSEG